jgi:tetratricopeptide (TPR) repeat protein
LGFLVRLALVCALGFWGAANLSAGLAPEGAPTWLNPIRSDLRIAETLRQWEEGGMSDEEARRFSRWTLALAPGQATAWSAAALLAEKRGDAAEAERLYREAARRAPLDWLVLTHRLDEAAVEDRAGSIDLLDLALRRFPQHEAILFGKLAEIASEPALLRRLVDKTPWSECYLRWSVGHQPDRAQHLLLALYRAGGSAPEPLSRMIDRLVADGRAHDAARLLVLTTGKNGAAGLVRDSRFETGFPSHALGWRYFPNEEADLTMAGNGLLLRFLDRPASLGNLRQVVVLPPGRYEMAVEASASNLHLPQPLVWTVACLGDWRVVGRQVVAPGAYSHATWTSAVDVPPDCPAQQITLFTERPSGAARPFAGSVLFHRVEIRPEQPI